MWQVEIGQAPGAICMSPGSEDQPPSADRVTWPGHTALCAFQEHGGGGSKRHIICCLFYCASCTLPRRGG